jgi:hypothetical protein
MVKTKKKRQIHPDVAAYFERSGEKLRPILEALRELVLECGPDLEEDLKWGQPSYSGKWNVCYLAAYSDHVNLGFFRGVNFRDPGDLLEGAGKGLRHVRIESIRKIDKKRIAALMKQALKVDKGRLPRQTF